MKVAPVYHKNYGSGQRLYLGFVVERRGSDRGNNFMGLARLARTVFAEKEGLDPFSIIVGGLKDADPEIHSA